MFLGLRPRRLQGPRHRSGEDLVSLVVGEDELQIQGVVIWLIRRSHWRRRSWI